MKVTYWTRLGVAVMGAWLGGTGILGAEETGERVFRDVDGREITAVIQGVDGGVVYLKRGATVYKFPMEKLSPSDQEFAKEWGKTNVRVQLQVTAQPREDKGRAKEIETGDREDKRTIENWVYEVAVTNRGEADFSNLVAEYDIYIRRTDTSRLGGKSNRKESPYHFSGTEAVAKLPSGKQTRIFCGPVELLNRKWIEHRIVRTIDTNGNYDSSETDDRYATIYEMEGVSIKLYKITEKEEDDGNAGGGKRLIFEYETEDTKVKKLDWSHAKRLMPETGRGSVR
jgi:hypothetical protein